MRPSRLFSLPSATVLAALTIFLFPVAGLRSMEIQKDQETPAQSGQKADAPVRLSGPPVTLVQDGKPTGPIVIAAESPPYTRRAAKELADFIKKISGASPEIIEGWPDPIPPSAIFVGLQPEMAKLFPDLDFDFQHPEEILIATRGNHLIVAGRDRFDPKNPDAPASGFQFGSRDVEGFQQEYGTINAVYTFLQDQLGIRWLWPSPEGEVIPQASTIVVDPIEFRYHPKLRQRHSIFESVALFRRGGDPKSPSSIWARRNRMQLDSLYAPATGHAFPDWWDRFHKDHPEYFALQPDGTRSAFPAPGHAKICESNPAVWDQWMADVAEMLQINPHQTVFSAAPNDSYASGHCVCDKCLAWDHPDGEERKYVYAKGVRQMRPALSDRTVTFANILARKLKEKYPDKDYKVATFAYGFTRPIPLGVVPDDNVIIGGVANVFTNPGLVDSNSPIGTTHWQQLEGWQKIAKHYIWRPNIGDPAGWKSGGPADVTRMAETFQKVVSGNCVGVSLDQVFFFWGTQAPLYYAMARLAWNPSLEPSAVLRDFYEKGFGPAADEVEAYWKLLDNAHNKIVIPDNVWSDGFTPELLEKAEGLLEQAKSKTESTRYADRVAFVRAGLEFLQLRTESAALRQAALASPEENPPQLEKIRANWKRLEALSEKYPMVIRQPTIRVRADTGRLSLMHPERLERELQEKAKTKTRPSPDATPVPGNDLDL